MPGSYNAGSVYAEATLNIEKFKAAASQMGGEAGKIVTALDRAGAGLEKSQRALDLLSQNLSAAKSRVDTAAFSFSSASSKLNELEEAANAASIKAAEMETAYTNAAQAFGESSIQAAQAKPAYEEAAANADKLNAAVGKQETVVRKSADALKRAELAVKSYENRISDTKAKIDGFNDTISSLNSELASGTMQGASSDMDAAGAATEALNDITDTASHTLQRGFASAVQSAVGQLDLFQGKSGLAGLALQSVQRSMQPLISKLGLTTLGFGALAAGAVYAAYKLYDYASGAKAAREAQEELNKTAQEWADTDVTTSYEKSKGMSAFGLDGDDFQRMVKGSRGWMEELTRVWSDGKKETDDIVSEMVSGFTSGTDELRDGLAEIKDAAVSGGYVSDGFLQGLDEDAARLDEIDATVEALLKKKQNGLLSEEDTQSLQALYDERESIEIKYKLKPDSENGNPFEEITTNVDAALSRGAKGTDVWADAYAAATQGLAQYNEALQQEYDRQYALIQLIEDDGERKQALNNLNQWWNETSAQGVDKYTEAVNYAMEATNVFGEGGSFDGMDDKLKDIYGWIVELSKNPGDNATYEKLASALSDLDETQIVEMTAALQSMQAAAENSGTELSDEAQTAVTTLTLLKNILNDETLQKGLPSDLMESINNMFGEGLDNEVLQIYAALDAQSLEESYKAWADGEHADIIPSLETTGLETSVTAVLEGRTVQLDLSTLDNLTGTVTTYDDKGNASTVKLEQLSDFTGTVTGYVEGKSVTVDLSTLDDQTGTVTAYTDNGEAIITELTQIQDLQGTITNVDIAEGAVPKVTIKAKVEFESGAFTNSTNPEISYASANGQVNKTGFLGIPTGTANMVDSLANSVKNYNEVLNSSDAHNAAQMQSAIFEQALSAGGRLNSDDGKSFEELAQYIANGLQLLKDGQLSEDEAAQLLSVIDNVQTILGSTEAVGALGDVGVDLARGLAEGFAGFGWASTAETVASDIDAAVRAAEQSHSPAERTKPIGSDVAAGIGAGMSEYDFSGDAETVATAANAALSSAMAGPTAKTLGRNFSYGLASGIRNGKSGVILAAVEVASAAAQAARNALDIHSPSRVMESIGEYYDLGFMGGIRNLSPDIERAVAEAVYVEPPRDLGEPSGRTTSIAREIVIDYDRLAEAMSNQHIELVEDGRVAARIRSRYTAEAAANRNRGIALGYGAR
jgi:hypothetical protein